APVLTDVPGGRNLSRSSSQRVVRPWRFQINGKCRSVDPPGLLVPPIRATGKGDKDVAVYTMVVYKMVWPKKRNQHTILMRLRPPLPLLSGLRSPVLHSEVQPPL